MKVVITGTSNGIGLAIAQKFLDEGHEVVGIDKCLAAIKNARYKHVICDILRGELPEIDVVDILINNAGVQNSGEDIDVNLKGTMRITEKYGVNKGIKSVLFIASSSARTGAEFAEYAASKGGMVAYMKHIALRIAKLGATANSLSPGGVTTELNRRVMDDPALWGRIMELTPLKKWASAEEIADFAYFMTVINKSMTAQDVLVDNGEDASAEFIW
ncbi:MAG: SDR family oxidoreductase [Clostridia bacterium]|nr:SDR family oxidoreductase [Clostridia bacterium]